MRTSASGASSQLPQIDDRWDQPGAFCVCLFTTVASFADGDAIRVDGYQNSGFTLRGIEPVYCALALTRLP